MKQPHVFIILIGYTILFNSCEKTTQRETAMADSTSVVSDPLPSWNETATKQKIINFVTEVTTEGNSKFVPAEERIATFDNDGTLWCEQPMYFEVVYSLEATTKIAQKTPALLRKPELKALASGDMKTFMKSGEKGILEAVAISHTAMGIDEFNKSATAWLDTARHKRFNRKYEELTYKPMVELLRYLRVNQFKTYIVSGGSSMFIRTFSDEAYDIPPEQVVGTLFKGDFTQKDSAYNVVLKPEVFHLDDNVGKPIAIYQFIGRKPILAFGNSDGDLQMLQWTSTNTRPNLSLILHHTDSIREYAYDRKSHIGKLDKALTEGQKKGWVIVDMKEDFGKVFSYE